MQARIELEQTGKYTNLDIVRGKVVLRVFSPSKISHIVVKLEGESRTRLEHVDQVRNRAEQLLEIHKLLYKTQTVFPSPGVQVAPGSKASFALTVGTYTYPFEFKIPFNNACLSNIESHGPTNPFNVAGFNLEVSKMATTHTKTTLPPTMHSNLEAGIRYFVKATVNVPSFFEKNVRTIQYFSFDPIEPPRKKPDGEAYARRQHQFSENPFPTPSRKFSLKLGKASIPPTPTSPTAQSFARFSVDVRVPNPAIFTCGQQVSLRVIIRQLSARAQPLFLKTFQIELIGHTKIRAQRMEQMVATSWVLTSLSNLHYNVGNVEDAEGTETELSKELWHGHTLPDAVCPSFKTCNVERFYELVVSVGLAYGTTTPGQDQFVVLPLRQRVEVFSGIKPPDELLRRVAEQGSTPRPSAPVTSATSPAGGLPAYAGASAAGAAPRPGQLNIPLGQGSGQHPEDPWRDPPPSYEDAMADGVRPVEGGVRPGYQPPQPAGAQGGLFADEKS